MARHHNGVLLYGFDLQSKTNFRYMPCKCIVDGAECYPNTHSHNTR